MVLSQHKATLYLLNYQVSAQKMTVQLRSISQEQSPADTHPDSTGESGTRRPHAPSGTEPLSPCSALGIPPADAERPNLTSPPRLAEQEQQAPAC